MEVRNCRGCGRLYNYIGGSYRNLCPACISKMEDKFADVKKYIEDNKYATMPQVSRECDISIEQIERWIREERLSFAEDSPMGISCESCGITIKTGRFCPSCKAKVTNNLASAYGQPIQQQTRRDPREQARMRFFDK